VKNIASFNRLCICTFFIFFSGYNSKNHDFHQNDTIFATTSNLARGFRVAEDWGTQLKLPLRNSRFARGLGMYKAVTAGLLGR